MTQIAALPTLDVYIAFNPTSGATLNTANQQALPASGASNSYWTNVTIYVQDFQTKAGRQHFLDRVEASTLNMTFNNRTGFFTGSPNVLDVRMPIAVKATWNGTPYNVYWGLTDSVTEQIIDQLNSELVVDASDLTKLLSLKYMASANFWPNYCYPPSRGGVATSATNWYRCDVTSQATVTSAVNPSVYGSSYTDYTAVNNFGSLTSPVSVGVTGLSSLNGSSLNTPSGVSETLYTSSSTGFTLTYSPGAGTAGGSGVATVNNTYDKIGSGSGYYFGAVAFSPNGAMVYDTDGALDLSNGSSSPSGYLSINDVPSSTSGGLDFWFNGGSSAGTQITTVLAGGYAGTPVQMWVSPTGLLEAVLAGQSIGAITSATSTTTALTLHGPSFSSAALSNNLFKGQWLKLTGFTPDAYNGEWQIASSNSTTINLTSTANPATATVIGNVSSVIRSNVTVNDNYWHHIGFVNNSSNQLCIYADGTMTPISWAGTYYNGWSTNVSIYGVQPLNIGGTNGALADSSNVASCPCIIDEVVISNNSNTSTLYSSEVLARYRAGSLLQLGYPTTGVNYTSADRIAEILTIAGFGYVSGNAIVLNSGVFSVNGSPYSYLTNQGAVICQPYYWDAPITGSTALDLILEVTDTDIGAFFQTNTGVFEFYTQNYYGTWTWNSSTNTGSWALNGTGSTAVSTWTDTNTGVPYYGPTLQTSRDDADLWTTVNVTPQAGAEQIYENTAQESRYGYSTLSKSSTVHASLNSALSTANYLGYLYRSPIPRVQNVELRAETVETNVSSRVVGYYNPTLLGTPFGTVINFQRTPPNAAGAGIINYNYVVESISHDFQADPGQWHVSFILDPYPVRS